MKKNFSFCILISCLRPILPLLIIGMATLFAPLRAITQNLVPNPSFEEYVQCPSGGSEYYLSIPPSQMNVLGWLRTSTASPDYFHTCATNPQIELPSNYFFAHQFPRTGDAFVGISCYSQDDEYREYIQVRLTEPLLAGKWYKVSFYLNKSDADYFSIATSDMAVLFTADTLFQNSPLYIDAQPQLKHKEDVVFADTMNWVLFENQYQAQGGELFMTIGNFKSKNESTVEYPQGFAGKESYYGIDDVSVTLDSLSNIMNSESVNFHYINPIHDFFQINFNSAFSGILSVKNAIGEPVYTASIENQQFYKTNFSNLKSGIYFFTLISNQKQLTFKLLKL